MSTNEPNDRMSGSTQTGVTSVNEGRDRPHFASRPPEILAQIPDLDSSEPAVVRSQSSDQGRILSSALSFRILAGAGALLLLLAVGLPLLLRGTDSDSASQDESGWQTEVPAPSASMAPEWDGMLSDSQDGSTIQPFGEQEVETAWNAGRQSTDWENPITHQPWLDQSETHPWNNQEVTPPTRHSPWQESAEQTGRSWDQRVDVAARSDFAGDSILSPEALAPRGESSPWDGSQTRSWPDTPYPSAGQARQQYPVPQQYPPARQTDPAMTPALPGTSYNGVYRTNTPLTNYNDTQPQVTTNRPAAINNSAGYGTNYQPEQQAVYRTTSRGDYPAAPSATGYPPANPPGGYPSASRPTTSYPNNSPMTDNSSARYSTPRYDSTTYGQSGAGTARFEGGIQSPQTRSTYDATRSRIF